MAVELPIPRPRADPDDTSRSVASPTDAVAELHDLVAELELTTRAVRTLAAVVVAIDAVTGPEGDGHDSPP